MAEIIPAFLPKNIEELEKQDSLLPEDIFVHLDMLEKDVWAPLRRPFEVHLMGHDPEGMMAEWVERGAKRVIAHHFSEEMLRYGSEVELGLADTLDIPIEEVEEKIHAVDFIHLMSIAEIGEQNHPLDTRIFDRIRELKRIFPETIISVDGGIKLSNAEELIDAGADRLIVGSAIIKAKDPEEAYEGFLKIAV